jgi:hypothetical protein
VVVPDIDVVVAGDLIEEASEPVWGQTPSPLEWPTTLEPPSTSSAQTPSSYRGTGSWLTPASPGPSVS